jgi:hypothetical protein
MKAALAQAREAFVRFDCPSWREWGGLLFPGTVEGAPAAQDILADRAKARAVRLEEASNAYLIDEMTEGEFAALEALLKEEEDADAKLEGTLVESSPVVAKTLQDVAMEVEVQGEVAGEQEVKGKGKERVVDVDEGEDEKMDDAMVVDGVAEGVESVGVESRPARTKRRRVPSSEANVPDRWSPLPGARMSGVKDPQGANYASSDPSVTSRRGRNGAKYLCKSSCVLLTFFSSAIVVLVFRPSHLASFQRTTPNASSAPRTGRDATGMAFRAQGKRR